MLKIYLLYVTLIVVWQILVGQANMQNQNKKTNHMAYSCKKI